MFLLGCPSKVINKIKVKSTVIKGNIEMPMTFNPLWTKADTIFVIKVYDTNGKIIGTVNSRNDHEYIVPEYQGDAFFIEASCYQNPNIGFIAFVDKKASEQESIVNINIETTAIAALYAKALIEKTFTQIPISLFSEDSVLKKKYLI